MKNPGTRRVFTSRLWSGLQRAGNPAPRAHCKTRGAPYSVPNLNLALSKIRSLRSGVMRLLPLALCAAAGVADCFGAAGDEAQFLSETRQLTFEGKRSGEGYFSPDGNFLIFQSERDPDNPFYQIYLLDLETGDTHRVSPGLGKTTCSFFRPGTDEVLFASTHQDPEARAKMRAELEFRASGKQRRYAWDYDE